MYVEIQVHARGLVELTSAKGKEKLDGDGEVQILGHLVALSNIAEIAESLIHQSIESYPLDHIDRSLA